jgi:hypothetical protein
MEIFGGILQLLTIHEDAICVGVVKYYYGNPVCEEIHVFCSDN